MEQRVKSLFKHGLQHDSDFGNRWPAVLGTLLDET
jgi:hypothetical protein